MFASQDMLILVFHEQDVRNHCKIKYTCITAQVWLLYNRWSYSAAVYLIQYAGGFWVINFIAFVSPWCKHHPSTIFITWEALMAIAVAIIISIEELRRLNRLPHTNIGWIKHPHHWGWNGRSIYSFFLINCCHRPEASKYMYEHFFSKYKVNIAFYALPEEWTDVRLL